LIVRSTKMNFWLSLVKSQESPIALTITWMVCQFVASMVGSGL
jgi:hypothetical protein